MKVPLASSLKHNRTTTKTRLADRPVKTIPHRWSQLRDRLLKLRAELAERIKQLNEEACEDTPSYSMHMADAGTDSFDRDLALGLASFEQETLFEVEAALRRIEDNTYGICELTGRPIPWARLVAVPWTRFSVDTEKVMQGSIHPHIGELRTIQPGEPGEKETPEDELLAPSGLVDSQ
jgi:RNA polymerase-binding transcription factor DksA